MENQIKGKSCCSNSSTNNNTELIAHWDNVYTTKPENQLGWYETNVQPSIQLIERTGLEKSARLFNVGAGSTRLVDELLAMDYTNLIATDISHVALEQLEERLNSNKITFIVDDLTQPTSLNTIEPVDCWIDRAVLHFFTEESDQDTYFNLLKTKVKPGGFALLAEFNLDGATKCSGLPVKRYNAEMLQEKLGVDFELSETFDYTYINPSGGERPYVYTLFQRK